MRPLSLLTAALLLATAPPVAGSAHLVPSVTVGPRAISPNGDGVRDASTVRATAQGVGTLIELRVVEGATVHRSWPPSPSPVEVTFDGRDTTGAVLPDGSYTVEAEATDAVTTEVARSEFVIDTQAPQLEFRKAPVGKRSGKLLLPLRIIDRSARASVQVRLSDHAGVVDTDEIETSSGGSDLSWRARYGGGARLYPGNYRVRATATDDAGNTGAPRTEALRVESRVRARVFERLPAAGKRVAITIDDCHFGRPWKRMLDTLRQMDARATFFCPGDRMMLFKRLSRRTVEEGHVLAAHGWDHASLAGRGSSATRTRLLRDRRAAWRIARVTTAPYFRPPYGSFDRATLRGAGLTGHGRVMMWDVDSRDSAGASGSALVRNAVRPARGGSIILMHTLDRTAAALPDIIRGLRDKGLRPVTLPELFRAAGYR